MKGGVGDRMGWGGERGRGRGGVGDRMGWGGERGRGWVEGVRVEWGKGSGREGWETLTSDTAANPNAASASAIANAILPIRRYTYPK